MRKLAFFILLTFLSLSHANEFDHQLSKQLTPAACITLPHINLKAKIINLASKIAAHQVELTIQKLEYQTDYRYPTSYDWKSSRQEYYADRIKKEINYRELERRPNYLDSLREQISYIVHEIIHEVYHFFKSAEPVGRFEGENHRIYKQENNIDEYFYARHKHIDHFFGTKHASYFTSGEASRNQQQFTQGYIPCPTTIGGHSTRSLLRAANAPDRGGLTKAGRALAKHGGRPNSAFPRPKGSPQAINKQGIRSLRKIIKHPEAKVTERFNRNHGSIIDIEVEKIGGARYHKDGRFITFLEPN